MVIILLSNTSCGDVLVWHHTCSMLETMKEKEVDVERLAQLLWKKVIVLISTV